MPIPKKNLVEAVARAIAREHFGDALDQDQFAENCWREFGSHARAAIDAINDSHIAWIAPREATLTMIEAMRDFAPEIEVSIRKLFELSRDAYLAEQGEQEED